MKQHVRVVLCVVAAAGVAVGASSLQAQVEPEPIWAYAWGTQPHPGDRAAPQAPPTRNLRPDEDPQEQTRPRTVEGSSATYSLLDVRDGHNVIDWFPGDHPAMSDIIKHGPKSLASERGRGCGSCHLPNGKGRPENAPPAGQPVGYTLQQLRDYRDDKRSSADPRKPNAPTMTALAKAMTEEEMRQAAEYFAAIPWTPWIRVVEADRIPEMHLEEGNMYITVGKEPTEPLAGRIVETPEDAYQANMVRNPRSGWVAYVPVGSLARGKKLVTTGEDVVDGKVVRKTFACAVCHGADLMGLGDFPGIAGRSPSYMMRQLWDMKRGTRNGVYAEIMKPVIANLTVDDMTAIVAYLVSITPPNPAPTRAPASAGTVDPNVIEELVVANRILYLEMRLRAMTHSGAFLGDRLPIFELRKSGGMTDMLVSSPALGRALAESLGKSAAVLMRGHGAAVVGQTLHHAVGRSVYQRPSPHSRPWR